MVEQDQDTGPAAVVSPQYMETYVRAGTFPGLVLIYQGDMAALGKR